MSDLDEVRVLVVDDNRDEAQCLAAMLELNGYRVEVAASADAALARVAQFQPQCLMLDIDMPGMDGLELSRRLRDGSRDDLVIIAVSGWGEEDEHLSAGYEHIDYYLRKPVEPARLARVLPPLTRSPPA
jgi:CheY-like chemotaxis protein